MEADADLIRTKKRGRNENWCLFSMDVKYMYFCVLVGWSVYVDFAIIGNLLK